MLQEENIMILEEQTEQLMGHVALTAPMDCKEKLCGPGESGKYQIHKDGKSSSVSSRHCRYLLIFY